MKITLYIVGVAMMLATIFPLSRLPYWWIRGFDFPRIQVAVICIAVLGLFSFYFSGSIQGLLFLLLLGICLLIQLAHLLPFCFFYPVQTKRAENAKPDSSVGILTANVLMSNRRAEDLIEIIRSMDPDIVLTLESDSWWENALISLEPDYAYRVKCPLDNLYGMHLYSRLPLNKSKIRYIIEDDIPSIHAQVELRSGTTFSLHCMHPAPPSPSENDESTERDAELLVVANEIAEEKQPSIVVGDLNDVAWSETTLLFRRISGLLDPRIGRGFFCTFHARFWFFRWSLDHVFHAKEFELSRIKRLPYFGSDHFPLYTKLSYSPGAEEFQEAPVASDEEEALAKEKINKLDS